MAYYLGIDASTQGIKAVVISEHEIIAESAVNFGRDLPQYNAPYGYLPSADSLVKQADPQMWTEALQMLFRQLADSGLDLKKIKAISGSGQQHGSVYLDQDFQYSRKHSPIWMDRSTSAECNELSEKFGDDIQLNTGSPAIERFTGPQIRKFYKEEPEAYDKTSYIHLVSSYLCSLLIGGSAPIDYGDGAGMNLLNLKTLRWDEPITEFTAPGLLEKLPNIVPSDTIAGTLCPAYESYGFSPDIPVIVWSGDNPSSLVGVGASKAGTVGISLGTSDTVFAPMQKYKTDPEGYGHVFGNPAGGFMSLICFSNGSLAREKVKNQLEVDWTFFDETALNQTLAGNNGHLMLPYFEAESTPLVLQPGVKYNYDQTLATPAQQVRAILESQALSMRLHTTWLDEDFKRIRLTGGASHSKGFQQIIADVFQAPVEIINVKNSAGLGAALRAYHTVTQISYEELNKRFGSVSDIVVPNQQNKAVYEKMLKNYNQFEKTQNV